jgi:TolB protein
MREPVVASLVVAACGVFAAAALSGSGGVGHSQARHGEIAFLRGPIRAARLSFVNADGSHLRKSRTRADDFPAWSPDGRRLAFAVEESRPRLYVTRADGAGRRPITPRRGYACYWLSWSPHGSRVAYTLNADCGGGMSIRVVDADGSGDKLLVRGEGNLDPVWSPDGKTVLYTAYGGARASLLVVDAGGGRGKPIPGAIVRSPIGLPMWPAAAWSRDGRYVYFIGDDASLWRLKRTGVGKRNLTPTLAVHSFELSSDGRFIVLAAVAIRGTRAIYRLNAVGGKLRKLTSGDGTIDDDPRWSPSGRLIAFTRRAQSGAQADIYVMDAEGRDERPITRSGLEDSAPAW